MKLKRILSILLALCLLFSLFPLSALAEYEEEEGNEGGAYLDFDATEYEVTEGGRLTVRIIRHGEDDSPVNVMVKAADFLSAYGTDYVVLGPEGEELYPVDGMVPELTALMPDNEAAEEPEQADAAGEAGKTHAEAAEGVYAVEPDAIAASAMPEEAETAETGADEEPAVGYARKAASTGSPLLDAAYTYLDIPLVSEKEETENAVGSALTELNEYFQSAQGAVGVVSFARGEREKVLTVQTLDNDAADGTRLLMLALLATDNEDIPAAAGANTYVNLLDDEDVVPPVYAMHLATRELTAEGPEAAVTVLRTAGTQYFSTVYLSTVQGTAPSAAYERLSNKALSFRPGETEKTVTLRAVDFTQGGTFGLRLESEDPDAVFTNHYEELNILPVEAAEEGDGTAVLFAQEGDETAELFAEDGGTAELMAANIKGSSTWFIDNFSGWKTEKTGSDKSNSAKINDSGNPYVAQYDKNDHSMVCSNGTYNLTGVFKIRFSSHTWGDGSGFITYFETDSDQSFPGCIDGWSKTGKYGWVENDLWVRSDNESRYIKFSVKATSSGKNNPISELDWFQLHYTQYQFDLKDSKETFTRKLYDFTTGSPTESVTYFDGQTTRVYNPGKLAIRYGSENVDGFYASFGQWVTITAANASQNEPFGIRLASVTFTNSGNNNSYTVNATNGAVSIKLDQSFVKTLINKGVVRSENQDQESIRVFPNFVQDTVQVNFENADRDDSNNATKGKFDNAHQESHFANILNSAKVEKKLHAGWLDYYAFTVPKGSVIRLKVVPDSDRTAAGAVWWPWSGSETWTYYKAGQRAYSYDLPEGKQIEEDDATMVEIVANTNLSIKPVTNQQTFYVGYSPIGYGDLSSMRDVQGNALVSSLEGAVISGSLTDPNSQKSDASGSMWLRDAFTGNSFTLTAIPPAGYYTYWGNLSGDTNNDGIIDNKDNYNSRMDAARSANPRYVYGSRLNMTIDTDNPRYYFQYMPLGSGGLSLTKTGTVYRETNTFYRLANNKAATSRTPVEYAEVNVAGVRGMTDANGRYSVPLTGLPPWGSISFMISSGGSDYSAVIPIENNLGITTLPAFEQFKPVSTTIKYGSSAVNGLSVAVKDDTLTVTAAVTTANSIYPKEARFFIHTAEGTVRVNCAEAEGYTTTLTQNGSTYTAALKFNPKRDMQSGDTLWVQFADQNGKWYPAIDMGYMFTTILTISEFAFPLLGSSLLENLVMGNNAIMDLLGNPLSNLMLKNLTDLAQDPYDYAPPAAAAYDDANNTWTRTDYTFGWSKEFEKDDSPAPEEPENGGAEQDEEAKTDQMFSNVLEDENAGQDSGANFSTEGSFTWKVTPSVGFKLTLSSRNGKTYFEDMFFFAKVEAAVGTTQTIMLPYGFSIVIKVGLDGSIQAIYRMYNDHKDPLEIEDAVEYTSESFGLFKKFNNTIRREFYLFIDPRISIDLGLSWAVITVNGGATFDFDMDFQFTETGINYYGDMLVKLKWNLDLLGFTVYEKKLWDKTVKLFNSQGTNEHIEFDASLQSAMEEAMLSDGSFALDRPAARDYLANRSGWYGEDGYASLFSLDASGGTVEQLLQSGTAQNPRMSLTNISDTEMLMVFVGDDTARSSVNKRAIFWSVGDGETWSEPALLDDDGTLDDYPDVVDLGDGRILVTWSSVDTVLPDGATVVEALQQTNLKAVFFDKSTKTFGPVEQLTKTTDEDYAADVLAHAAYDPDTGRLILYYTKTEYEGITELDELGLAISVMAYLFYENGEWKNTGDVYAAEELEGTPADYAEQWYGQRFLDLRTDANHDYPRVVDSDAISYNGLALFTWTVDWDDDLSTVNDRDVFVQIYDFEEDIFTHIIRVTEESGTYALPQFACSDNNTYLFYGANLPEEDGSQRDHAEIRYLNISYLIANGLYTLNTASNYYYDLKYTQPDAIDELPGGGTEIIPGEVVWAAADKATDCDNIGDYRVFVNDEGQLYLFWTESETGSRQIEVSLLHETDEDKESDVENGSESGKAAWSEPIMLTSGDGVCYTGIGAAVKDGKLYIASGKENYNDSSDTAIVLNVHTPFASVILDGVEADVSDNAYPSAGDSVLVTATLKNAGLLPADGAWTVTFQVNGGEAVTVEYPDSAEGNAATATISGGGSAAVSAYLTVPEEFEELTFTAAFGGETCSTTLEKTVKAALEDSEIAEYETDAGERYQALTATVISSGNVAAENLTLTAVCGGDTVGTAVIELLAPGETQEAEIELDIPDSAFEIAENGAGLASVSVELTANGELQMRDTLTAVKQFDGDAIALLAGATVEDNAAFSLTEGGSDYLQPVISGTHSDELHVEWLTTSNVEVVSIDYSNGIYAGDPGTAELTGILVPTGKTYRFGADGKATEVGWTTVLPESMIQTVTATVTVTGAPDDTPTDDESGDLPDDGSWPSDTPSSGSSDTGAETEPNAETETDAGTDAAETVFADVSADAWYADAVTWAVAQGITEGTGEDTFSPEDTCTRSQMVTFLWRAAGSPEPAGTAMPFTDVKAGSYYEKAALWAFEQGITTGTGDGFFSPDAPCTRSQTVTFLWRAAGSPQLSDTDTPFDDVDGETWYAVAVAWAAAQGITNGTGANTFSPENSCTRAQMVTFLWRAAGSPEPGNAAEQ